MRPLIFILLKIVEIAAYVFVPYGMGCVVLRLTGETKAWLITWALGLMICTVIAFLTFLVFLLILANWNLAGLLKKKIKK